MTPSWLHQQIATANQGKVGLIDIGSNSIRLVVYDRLKRAPASIYNEKVMCQLGKGLGASGKLSPQGVVMANATIARFVALAKNMEVTELDIVATAAVRDASDGPEFVEKLERAHNIFIEVISGKREAKLGAYGILASMHKPEGLVGDLGGGSLELVGLDNNQRIGERVSLPIGVLRLQDECDSSKSLRKKVHQVLSDEAWLAGQQGQPFYAIGGSFRNLARIHAIASNYPLSLTHGYTISTDDIAPLLKEISEAKPSALVDMPGVSSKRAAILPAAAMVLDELIQVTHPSAIIFSASGIREGYLFEKLSPFVREEDGLIAACVDVATNINLSVQFAGELFTWVQAILKQQSESSMRIAYAACLLQDVARYIHPDHRAEWSYRRIIESNLHGLNHKQRVQLALTLYHRYRFKLKHNFSEISLLNEKSNQWAVLVGSIASLAHHLTGSIAGTLPQISLDIDKQQLTLPKGMEALQGEVIDKRLSSIYESFAAWKKHK